MNRSENDLSQDYVPQFDKGLTLQCLKSRHADLIDFRVKIQLNILQLQFCDEFDFIKEI